MASWEKAIRGRVFDLDGWIGLFGCFVCGFGWLLVFQFCSFFGPRWLKTLVFLLSNERVADVCVANASLTRPHDFPSGLLNLGIQNRWPKRNL